MKDEVEKSFITKENINHIQNFGLSVEEATVYLSLIRRGTRGEVVGKIKDELEIGRTTIYAIMERLNEKGWVTAEEISKDPRRIKYVANTPYEIFRRIIQNKDTHLKAMKQSRLFIGDSLDKIYQGAKKLNIDTIHPGAYKYLKPLIEQNFKIKSEVIEHSEDPKHRLSYDYELKGPIGMPKDCGLIIFEFNDNIEEEKNLIKEALEIFKSKTEYEIRRDKIPGFEDVTIEDTKFGEYIGTNVLIKLKFKKKWWSAGHQAVLPIKNRIFLIFGGKENFRILMDTIISSEKFHHLV